MRVYDHQGRLLYSIGEGGELDYPLGLYLKGEELFVANNGANNVLVYSPWTTLATGTSAVANGTLVPWYNTDLVGSSATAAVSGRLQKFDPDGVFLGSLPIRGSGLSIGEDQRRHRPCIVA